VISPGGQAGGPGRRLARDRAGHQVALVLGGEDPAGHPPKAIVEVAILAALVGIPLDHVGERGQAAVVHVGGGVDGAADRGGLEGPPVGVAAGHLGAAQVGVWPVEADPDVVVLLVGEVDAVVAGAAPGPVAEEQIPWRAARAGSSASR